MSLPISEWHLLMGLAIGQKKLKDRLKIDVISLNDDQIVFDFVGIDAPIANALRRILLSEVPTMAIEKVIVKDNTSIVPDEIFAHRIGLIPLKVDPRLFEYIEEEEETESDTLVFKIDVSCKRRPGVPDDAPEEEKYERSRVLSGDLEWVPQGDQADRFPEGIGPVHDDIVLTKLRPGQSVKVELHAYKGIGKQHAKWSPVCTASYRLLPVIELDRDFVDDEAEVLVSSCPMKVFDYEDFGASKRAVVARPRDCTVCRECVRHDWSTGVKLMRQRDHFIFSIETTGALPPEVLFREAIGVLVKKCETLLEVLGQES
eukprot:Rmarinus@m.3736